MNLITVVPFNNADKERAERLLDCIYWIGGQKASGHVLLVASPDVHPEYKIKVRIAAEVAFSSVDMMELGAVHGETKFQKINNVFRQAARYILDCYQHPFLWLESDCVPLKASWRGDLQAAYEDQPRRYLGRYMMGKDNRFLSRVAIYPANAINDLDSYCGGPAPFERIANILPRASSTRLIHIAKWSEKTPLPEGAVLTNGDRSGVLVEKLIEEAPVVVVKRRGRSKKVTV